MAARFTAPLPLERGSSPIGVRRAGSPGTDGGLAGLAMHPTASGAGGSTGLALDPILRPALERQFGMSFASVRIRPDGISSELRRSSAARAVTAGERIAFDPAASAGGLPSLPLLAHELAHISQQRRWREAGRGAADHRVVEADADAAATAVAAGRSFQSSVAAAPGPHAQEAQPTPAEIRQDQKLRRFGHWPREALQHWTGLSAGEQTVVVMRMAGDYGVEFAREFQRNAQLPRSRRREPVAQVTNAPTRTDAQRRAGGWEYAGDPQGMRVWVNPYGDEIHILPTRPSANAPTSPSTSAPGATPTPSAAEPPAVLPARSTWGRVVEQRDGASIGGTTGRVTRYTDGTVSISSPDGSTMTYRPHADSVGGYDVYDSDGKLIENLIWLLDPDEVFGHRTSGTP
jgi:hypothetical protein